jgi:hypothetical protein
MSSPFSGIAAEVAAEVAEAQPVVSTVETVEPADLLAEEAQVEEVTAEDEPVEELEARRTTGFEKRVGKLNAKIDAAKQEAEYWRNEALKSKQTQTPQAQVVDPAKPSQAQYATQEEFLEASMDYRQALRDQAANQAANQASYNKALSDHSKREAAFAKVNPDYADMLDEVSDMQVHSDITQALVESDVGPAMAYHLAKNPNEIERLNALSSNRRLIEIGKIEDKLIAKKVAPVKAAKLAPAPVKPATNGVSATSINKNEDSMTPQEFMRYRNEKFGNGRAR